MTVNGAFMKITVLDGYTLNPGDNSWEKVEELADPGGFTVYDRTEEKDIVERSRGADILLTNKTPLRAETLAELPDLKFIGVLATGHDVVDSKAAARRGIPVSNVPGYGTESVSQFVFSLLLSMCTDPAGHNESVRRGDWTNSPDWSYWNTPQIGLSGRTLGIIGFGGIGRRVAELGFAFGMKVIAYSPRPKDAPPHSLEFVELDELVRRADALSLHCPLTEETANIMSRERINAMKPGAFLINTARGPLIDEQALAEALTSGHLGGAALDVVSSEPITPDNPLLSASNCLITPHMAWATINARKKLMSITADNIRSFKNGTPCNVVNGL